LTTTSLSEEEEFGGNSMKNFLLFLATVYVALFLYLVNQKKATKTADDIPTLRVFASSSFSGATGPGVAFKEIFEKTCSCRVEYIEGSDSGILLQRLKIEGESLGADLMIGFDQYDLQKALSEQSWKQIDFSNLELDATLKQSLTNNFFIPYDWGILTFVGREKDLLFRPEKINDLLDTRLYRKIGLEDPRTSSPGLQFLFWIIKNKGEVEGFQFIQKMFDQAHSHSPSWATAYGLFLKKQFDIVFSYQTSPLYHQLVEKDNGYTALQFKEPMQVQYEFAGIPSTCRQCELSAQFVNLMLSADGQKIIMEKNFMYPILKSVQKGTHLII
jgi:thiamine transport system substrate-binding protein